MSASPQNCGRLASELESILDRSRSREVNLSESKRHSGFVPNRDGSPPTPNFPCFWRSPVLTWSLDAKSDIDLFYNHFRLFVKARFWASLAQCPSLPEGAPTPLSDSLLTSGHNKPFLPFKPTRPLSSPCRASPAFRIASLSKRIELQPV